VQQWTTGEDLANELCMLRAAADYRAFLVLEGPTDCQALDPHVDPVKAATFPAFGKKNAEEAIMALDSRNIDDVLAILDRDWVGILDSAISSTNVVYTDFYDLDATIIFSGTVIERVLSALSDRERREAHLENLQLDCETLAVALAGPVGILRLVSVREGHEIRCEGFPMHDVINGSRDAVDLQRLCAIAIARSKTPVVSATALQQGVEAQLGQESDLHRYCCGHELASALAVLVSHWGGSASRGLVEKVARAAFGAADLATTALFGSVTQWAEERRVTVWVRSGD
jgi:hypothetical protein